MTMYCKSCGKPMVDTARFCSVCGAEAPPPMAGAYAPGAQRTLVRPRFGRMIGGVCQGLANQYGWDVSWIRVIAVLTAVFGGGLTAIAYVVLWIVAPEEPLALSAGQPLPPSSL
jgi:phage shock protein C